MEKVAMNPIDRGATRILSAPKGWDAKKHGPWLGLPIIDAHGYMYSYWRPTLLERFRVAIGTPVRLAVVGTTHPPVAISVTKT
jgi:hypothetical protein